MLHIFLREILVKLDLNACDFSSHTFRKGGARHNYLYVRVRWHLDLIMDWCRWSLSEDNEIQVSRKSERLGLNLIL